MNNVQLMGRLTRDLELKYYQSANGNNAYANFLLAVDKNLSKDKKQELLAQGKATADFINCKIFGKQAETLEKYVGKGNRLLIQGTIQTGSYEKEGRTIYTTDVLVNNFNLLDFKNDTSKNDDFDFVSEPEFNPINDKRIPF